MNCGLAAYNTIQKRLANEIMSTNLFISVSSIEYTGSEITNDINNAILYLKKFEQKFSRFINNNYLDIFNKTSGVKYDKDFAQMIKISKKYHKLTDGYFNPAILNVLLNQGYNTSKITGFYDSKKDNLDNDIHNKNHQAKSNLELFNELKITKEKITKPKEITIDLGGIGKSYAINQIHKSFKKKYKNYCIEIGGDMFVSGRDTTNNYAYWAIEVASPNIESTVTPLQSQPVLLTVINKAVATSGTDKRRWYKNGAIKNHIINPFKATSVESNFTTVTTILDDIVSADIWAKVLLMRTDLDAIKYSEKLNIPAIFITKGNQVILNELAKQYTWHDTVNS